MVYSFIFGIFHLITYLIILVINLEYQSMYPFVTTSFVKLYEVRTPLKNKNVSVYILDARIIELPFESAICGNKLITHWKWMNEYIYLNHLSIVIGNNTFTDHIFAQHSKNLDHIQAYQK